MDRPTRNHWTEQRVRKEPTLYDEWLSEEKDNSGSAGSAHGATKAQKARRSGSTAGIGSSAPDVVSRKASYSRVELYRADQDYSSSSAAAADAVSSLATSDGGSMSRSFVQSSTSSSATGIGLSSTPSTGILLSRTTMETPSPVGSLAPGRSWRKETTANNGRDGRSNLDQHLRMGESRDTPSKSNGILGRRSSKSQSTAAVHPAPDRAASSSTARPRTRTVDDRSSADHISQQASLRQRQRVGSMNSAVSRSHTTSGSPAPPATNVTPSTSSRTSPYSSPFQQFIEKQPQRATQPLDMATTPPPATPPPPPPILSNELAVPGDMSSALSKRIQQLMKQLHGRMHGEVMVRQGVEQPWHRAQCFIQEHTSSLMYDLQNDRPPKVLISDLRGIHVEFRSEQHVPFIVLRVPNSAQEAHLRLNSQNEFDSWLAALLTWHHRGSKEYKSQQVSLANFATIPTSVPPPVPRRSSAARSTSPHSRNRANSDRSQSRRKSAVMSMKEAPVIKIGKMIYWDTDFTFGGATGLIGQPASIRPQAHRTQSYGSRRWRRISAQLRENGELKLHADADNGLLSVVQLSQLSRCAIQRLDASVLDNGFCIAIYPQYTSTPGDGTTVLRPIFLGLESRVLHEVWFVLLRAFTIPQLYGTQTSNDTEQSNTLANDLSRKITHSTAGMFRMERALSIRVVEAKLLPSTPNDVGSQYLRNQPQVRPEQFGYHVEVLLDNETRAKTTVKAEGLNPLWGETFDFSDLPSVLTSASVVVKRRPPDAMKTTTDGKSMHDVYGFSNDAHGGFSGVNFDVTVGKVEIYFDEIAALSEVEKWWPLVNMFNQKVGEVLIKARAEEGVVMMAHDYEPISELLHRFSNGLTLQLAQIVPSELRRLSDCLLNIFQVSGKAGDWIMALVEDEIDSVTKETPITRLRYNGRLGHAELSESLGSGSAHADREVMVRDISKHATLEANLLFRGNTLLTKSLDSHMRRVGKDFLEEALSAKVKDICHYDPDCEVDPNRATEAVVHKNWRRLIVLTREVWKSIVAAKQRCPIELRKIFRHIRACAEDRYGDFLRSVSYSSVSGFLFLRFFCPAILNPKLFGLFKGDIKPNGRRTLTLIAKSLQTLANMASFGTKEQWMEPMNIFLTQARADFKDFIDDICYVPVPASTRVASSTAPVAATPNNIVSADIHLSYTTPMTIMQRLPPTSREGFPSLPYLIDQPRSFSELVNLWLETTSDTSAAREMAFPGRSKADLLSAIRQSEGEVKAFHEACMGLQARTQQRLSQAERAERPSSALSFQWEELIDQLQSPTDDSKVAARPHGSPFETTSQHVMADIHAAGSSVRRGEVERLVHNLDGTVRPGGSSHRATQALEQTEPRFTPENGERFINDNGTVLTAGVAHGGPQRNRTMTQARPIPINSASDTPNSPISGEEIGNFSSSAMSSDTEHTHGTTALPKYDRDTLQRLREHEEKANSGKLPTTPRDGANVHVGKEKEKKQGRKLVSGLRKKRDDRGGNTFPQSP